VDHRELREHLDLPEALGHQVPEALLALQGLAVLQALQDLLEHQVLAVHLELLDLLERQALEVRLVRVELLEHLDLAVLRDLLGPADLLA
jgi:hypothetical protein